MLPNNDAVIACYTQAGGILEGVQVNKIENNKMVEFKLWPIGVPTQGSFSRLLSNRLILVELKLDIEFRLANACLHVLS